MPNPSTYRYSESHEWFANEGGIITLGLTPFAVNNLTDLTYVELKPVGTRIAAGDSIGEVESVKTTSDVYSAVAGEIADINADVVRDPSIVNADPLGKGWLVKIKTNDQSALQRLMDQATYDAKHPV